MRHVICSFGSPEPRMGDSIMRMLLSLVILASLVPRCIRAGEPSSPPQQSGVNEPWTFQEAYAQAMLHQDEYARYVALRLAAASGEAEKHRAIRGMLYGTSSSFWRQNRNELSLVELIGGSAAIRESLQLDTIVGDSFNRHEYSVPWDYGNDIDKITAPPEDRRDGVRNSGFPLPDLGIPGVVKSEELEIKRPEIEEPELEETLWHPRDICADTDGGFLISDFGAKRIRRIEKSGEATTLHRWQKELHFGDSGIYHNETGELFFADTLNSQILKIDHQGDVEVVYSGMIYQNEYTVKMEQAFEHFPDEEPRATRVMATISVAPDGSVLFVETNKDGHQVVRIDREGSSSVIATIEKREPSEGEKVFYETDVIGSELYHPTSITGDNEGNLYFAEAVTRCVKKLDRHGNISVVAGQPTFAIDRYDYRNLMISKHSPLGGDGGLATEARLLQPSGLAVDQDGNLFISDAYDHCIRKVDSDGRINTIAGTTVRGFSGDGGLATNARLNVPRGMAFDSDGNLYFADEWNHRIRRVDSSGIISTVSGSSEPSIPKSYSFNLRRGVPSEAREEVPTDTALLKGPVVESHPFGEMLAGRRPEIASLARHIPNEFYYIRFESLTKFRDAAHYSELISGPLRTQSLGQSSIASRKSGIARQLALPLWQEDPIFEKDISEIAISGSDLFWNLGSDVSVLIEWSEAGSSKKMLDRNRDDLRRSHRDAALNRGSYRDVVFTEVAAGDNRVHFFDAQLTSKITVRSNSQVALRRIIDASLQSPGDEGSVSSLAQSDDFLYVRTLLPRNAVHEDGLIFLSDAFIRQQVSPAKRIKQQRRLSCATRLKSIQYAALMHRTQTGHSPTELSDLLKSKALATDKYGLKLECPDGGEYDLSADGQMAVCSFHGTSNWMRPCCENELKAVTEEESVNYTEFVEHYEEYWPDFFDPIGIQVGINDQVYRAETVILPLIQNSVYDSLAGIVDIEPSRTEMAILPKRTIFGVSLKLNKQSLAEIALADSSYEPALVWAEEPDEVYVDEVYVDEVYVDENVEPRAVEDVKRDIDDQFNQFLQANDVQGQGETSYGLGDFVFDGLGDEVGFYACDARPNFRFDIGGALAMGMSEDVMSTSVLAALVSSFSSPVYVAIEVEEPSIVDQFLQQIDPLMNTWVKQGEQGFIPIEKQYSRFRHHEHDVRSFGINVAGFGMRWFCFRMENTVFLTSQIELVQELIESAKSTAGSRSTRSAGHLRAIMMPDNRIESQKSHLFEWAAANQKACDANLLPLNNELRASTNREISEIQSLAGDREGKVYLCPSGGQYRVEHTAPQHTAPQHTAPQYIACTVHGHAADPRQPAAPASESSVDSFIDDVHKVEVTASRSAEGLRATLTVVREQGASKTQ